MVIWLDTTFPRVFPDDFGSADLVYMTCNDDTGFDIAFETSELGRLHYIHGHAQDYPLS